MWVVEILKSVVFGIVQGITEWLPISSTGHLILLENIMPFDLDKSFVDTFLVVIQLGSILAVVVLYFSRLNPFSKKKTEIQKKETWSLWGKVVVAAIPAVIVGLLLDDFIDEHFYNWQTVAITLILYGVLFIVVENLNRKPKILTMKSLSYKTALGIGLFQVLALIPGTSRSGATILGAVLLGTSRVVAAEFSFFLAIPMMFGASLLKLVKAGFNFSALEWSVLLVGMLVAFIVSVFTIRFLIGYLKKHDFKAFGYYRIVLGIIVIVYFFFIYTK